MRTLSIYIYKEIKTKAKSATPIEGVKTTRMSLFSSTKT